MYAIVMFNFKKRQKVRTSFLIPMGGAVPRPELAVSINIFLYVRVEDSLISQRTSYNLCANATDNHGVCTNTLVRALRACRAPIALKET